MVWRCLRLIASFCCSQAAINQKTETKPSSWHSIVMALMQQHGRCCCSGSATLPAPPRCPCEGSCRRSRSTAAAAGPCGIVWKSLHAISTAMGQEQMSSLWPESDLPGLPSSDLGYSSLWKRPIRKGLWFMGGLSHQVCDNCALCGPWSHRGRCKGLPLVLQHTWATVQCVRGAEVMNLGPVLCGMLWCVPRRKEDLPLQSHG